MSLFNTIGAKFEGTPRIYTYKVLATAGFVEGDKAVVDVSGQLKIVDVVRVDRTPQIDPKADFEYKWVVCRVDLAAYKALKRTAGVPVATTPKVFMRYEALPQKDKPYVY